MKKLLKRIFYFKSILVKSGKLKGFIHPISDIKGYNKIDLDYNSMINKNVRLLVQKGKFYMEKNSYINNFTNINIVEGTFRIGENSFINNFSNIITLGDISIGANVLIANNCSIISGDHNFRNKDELICNQGYEKKDITICDDVWIGCNSVILGGVIIGKGSVIGSGSVVKKNIGEYEIWAGNPAKFIKKRE